MLYIQRATPSHGPIVIVCLRAKNLAFLFAREWIENDMIMCVSGSVQQKDNNIIRKLLKSLWNSLTQWLRLLFTFWLVLDSCHRVLLPCLFSMCLLSLQAASYAHKKLPDWNFPVLFDSCWFEISSKCKLASVLCSVKSICQQVFRKSEIVARCTLVINYSNS